MSYEAAIKNETHQMIVANHAFSFYTFYD